MADYIEELSLKVSDFSVSLNELALYMGYHDRELPQHVTSVCAVFFDSLATYFKPKAGFGIFGQVECTPDGFFCNNLFFKTGKRIAVNYRDATRFALFAVTAGPEMDNWSRQAFTGGKELLGYIIDCAGSILAEAIADKTEARIAAVAQKEGLTITNRYSPGYCGWNVKEQEQLFTLLPPGFCGIHLTESALMNPIKSVSGVIGIGKDLKKGEYACNICTEENCYKSRLKKQQLKRSE